MNALAICVLLYVTLQRLGELALARRNTARLLAAGGREVAARHYPLIVAVHAAWIIGLWIFAWDRAPHFGWLYLFALLQGARFWVLATLGPRWTTRIIIVPGETLVRRGPYRFLKHPNYVVVSGEIIVLPLAFGLPVFALVFSVLNAAVLFVRIRAEDKALAELQHPADRHRPA